MVCVVEEWGEVWEVERVDEVKGLVKSFLFRKEVNRVYRFLGGKVREIVVVSETVSGTRKKVVICVRGDVEPITIENVDHVHLSVDDEYFAYVTDGRFILSKEYRVQVEVLRDKDTNEKIVEIYFNNTSLLQNL